MTRDEFNGLLAEACRWAANDLAEARTEEARACGAVLAAFDAQSQALAEARRDADLLQKAHADSLAASVKIGQRWQAAESRAAEAEAALRSLEESRRSDLRCWCYTCSEVDRQAHVRSASTGRAPGAKEDSDGN